MSRAYNIQVNVGDLDHELAGLSDQDLAAWTRGFLLGLHGRNLMPGHSCSADCGNAFGHACREKTEAFMAKAAEGGRNSAAARIAKRGTAQPPKGVRGNAEGAPKVLRENAEVTSNQKPVTINKKPESKDDGIPPGVSTPDPLPKPPHYARFEQQYQTPKPEPVVLPFEQTPEGKACLENRARIRAARLAKEQQSA